MQTAFTTDAAALSSAGLATAASPAVCLHCGAPCRGLAVRDQGKDFCCHGCLTVFELLQENGLGDFYRLSDRPGVRVRKAAAPDRFAFLDEPAVRDRLLAFSDGENARVRLHLPAIHCVACVWLLENLFKLHPGIGRSVVDFEKKEISVSFAPALIRLSELVTLLVSIGYEPTLNLDTLDAPVADRTATSLYLKLGVAGFACGNIMLFSICLYSGMDRFSAPIFRPLFGWVSLLLSLPVLVYSAGGYWRAAWLGVRQRTLTIDFPIALGLAALFVQSVVEVVAGAGLGYLDSLTGLVFFLLVGRVFQDRTYRRLSFDRDYRSFFPLAVRRLEAGAERTVALSELAVGDRLRLRHGELIPADGRIVRGDALIDYSFVTGESEPVARQAGDLLYAGGQQVGGTMELEMVKPVSQGYLTSLWSHESFAKTREAGLNTVLNRFSRGFTLAVVTLACAAGAWWWLHDQEVSRALRSFTSVLIVACPCALALSAPFALGTAQRWLGRVNVFARNAGVVETLAGVDAVVFDKTGTLTQGGSGGAKHHGPALSDREWRWVKAAVERSTHPYSRQIAASLRHVESSDVTEFQEVAGQGICARVEGVQVRLGSAAWVTSTPEPPDSLTGRGVGTSDGYRAPDGGSASRRVDGAPSGSGEVHLAIDGRRLGVFRLCGAVRPGVESLMSELAASQELVLLSGDNDRARVTFESLLGGGATLQFGQSPADKRSAIERLQARGRTVMMVGDGLNDAGALRQSDVGVAVVESVGTFSPASDLIMEARDVPRLGAVLAFARKARSVVWASIILSLLYNAIGLSFAATGRLSPILCAILMPLSSITVVTFACAAVGWQGRRTGLLTHFNQETNP